MKTPNFTAANIAMFKRMTIGDRIRWLIELKELKQTEIAEMTGVTQAAISNLVTDSSRKPSAPTLLKLAEVLQCNPTWIITGEGDPFAWAAVTAESQVELLNLFKAMGSEGKAALLAVARSMAAKK